MPGMNTLAYYTKICITTFRITAFSVTTKSITTFSTMTNSIKTFSTTTLSIKGLYVALNISNTQHIQRSALYNSVIMVNVVRMSVAAPTKYLIIISKVVVP